MRSLLGNGGASLQRSRSRTVRLSKSRGEMAIHSDCLSCRKAISSHLRPRSKSCEDPCPSRSEGRSSQRDPRGGGPWRRSRNLPSGDPDGRTGGTQRRAPTRYRGEPPPDRHARGHSAGRAPCLVHLPGRPRSLLPRSRWTGGRLAAPCAVRPASPGFARGSVRRPWCSASRGTWNPRSLSILILPRLIEDLQHPLHCRRLRQETTKVLEARHGPEDNRIASVFNDQSTPLFNLVPLAELNRDRRLAPPGDLDDLPSAVHTGTDNLLPDKHSYGISKSYPLHNPMRGEQLSEDGPQDAHAREVDPHPGLARS